jgi:hypothetical protein
MSIEVQNWLMLPVAIICIVMGVVPFVWLFETAVDNARERKIVGGSRLVLFVLACLFWVIQGCIALIDVTPDLISMVQNNYTESDCVIVEFTTRTNGEYDDVVAYFPELDENKRITFEEDPDNLEVGKTYRVGYYRLDERITLVRFLYCVDDMNEEAQSTE